MSESVLTNRKLRFHDNPHDISNWCKICGLYYCWHPECKDFKNRSFHKFIPQKERLPDATGEG